MLIICTTEELNGTVTEVDRECELWFEKDYEIDKRYAVSIFPKNVWVKASEIVTGWDSI